MAENSEESKRIARQMTLSFYSKSIRLDEFI